MASGGPALAVVGGVAGRRGSDAVDGPPWGVVGSAGVRADVFARGARGSRLGVLASESTKARACAVAPGTWSGDGRLGEGRFDARRERAGEEEDLQEFVSMTHASLACSMTDSWKRKNPPSRQAPQEFTPSNHSPE